MVMRGLVMQPDTTQSWADRQAAARSYLDEVNWPEGKTEAWKFTSLSHLSQTTLQAPVSHQSVVLYLVLRAHRFHFTAGLIMDFWYLSQPVSA